MARRGNSKEDLEADGYGGSPLLIGPHRSQLFKHAGGDIRRGSPLNYGLQVNLSSIALRPFRHRLFDSIRGNNIAINDFSMDL